MRASSVTAVTMVEEDEVAGERFGERTRGEADSVALSCTLHVNTSEVSSLHLTQSYIFIFIVLCFHLKRFQLYSR